MNEAKKNRSIGHWIMVVIGIILCIVLTPILIINVTLIVKGIVDEDHVPDFAGYSPLIVLSDSMVPTIYSGDLIIVKTIDPPEVEVGDVISFKEDEAVITHRIVAIETTPSGQLQFTTKGDVNSTEDIKKVSQEDLVGEYIVRIPGVGTVAMFLQTPTGLIIFVAVPLALFIIYDILSRRNRSKKEKQLTDELMQEIERLKSDKES